MLTTVLRHGLLRCLVVCLAMGLFVGCARSKRSAPDGAPKHIPVNLDRLPNAVPKVEPLSRYGNRFKNSNTYVVKNKRYAVMPTSRGYKAFGEASWYGTKFHTRKTSSGEPYNMFAMTAAHRSLPLPTYAKVTNVDNGKSVIVKVNDRGPFRNDRLLDLSYAAAHKLGILAKGTGRVCVESVDPRDHHGSVPRSRMRLKPGLPVQAKPPAQLARAAGTAVAAGAQQLAVLPNKPNVLKLPQNNSPGINKTGTGNKLYIHLGAYNQKSNADVLAKKISEYSKLPILIQENKNSKRTLYRVRIGPVKNQQEVTLLAQKLASAHFPNPVIVRE